MLRKPRRFMRRFERYCCGCLSCLPLIFVYGLTTWAVWVEVDLGLIAAASQKSASSVSGSASDSTPPPSSSSSSSSTPPPPPPPSIIQSQSRWVGKFTSLLGIILYILLNICYTVAVFTDPGSPLGNTSSSSSAYDYSHLPTTELPTYEPLTVASDGSPRFCRKCQLPKPDRAHHCSTCNRCILKMDHHCPWLATCVGFRNYKSFLLFLCYVSCFCWLCFAVSLNIIIVDVISLADPADTPLGIGCFILCVLAGVLGLVLTGFTAWHLSLVSRNMTTIESLERTRYVVPLREIIDQKRREILTAWNQGLLAAPTSFSSQQQQQQEQQQQQKQQQQQQQQQQLPPPPPANIQKRTQAQEAARANGHFDPWQTHSPSGTFSHTVDPYQQPRYSPEHLYELERHYLYLDDGEAADLPHAFDRGWRENFRAVFGEVVVRWFLPTRNARGDGWVWPVNEAFVVARGRLEEKRRKRVADVVEGWRCFYWTQQQRQGPPQQQQQQQQQVSGTLAGHRQGYLISQAGAWPKPKNPFAVAAAKKAEEEMRMDVEMEEQVNSNVYYGNDREGVGRGRDDDDNDDDQGLSMKTLDLERVQRGN